MTMKYLVNLIIKSFALLIVFLALILTGCGGHGENAGETSGPMELLAMVKSFEVELRARGRNDLIPLRKIGFDNLNEGNPSGTVLGVCYLSSGEIFLDFGHWLRMNSEARLALVYHELGHCMLGQGHRFSNQWVQLPDPNLGFLVNTPKSLMQPYLISDYAFLNFKNYYLTEMAEFRRQSLRSQFSDPIYN